ncbi:hypothetical protein NAHI_26 [Klebsiella phage vB_KpnP_NahiliMali]|uniref:Uncharacterized protein n=1 Tax=Klebsiella phage vB_KpnP_NahiliMali TaxID=2591373 RepID=A0A5B9NPB0_9CAUD|nr:hypothetical protein NAHI_26 [Klebsiella phage vB_KpnP_NahiliMali]
MKKGVLLALLIYVAVGLYANYQIPLLHLSETSKVIILTLSGLGFLSVALLVTRVLQATCGTTKRRAGLSRLQTLKEKEREIGRAIRRKEGTLTSEDLAHYKDFLKERHYR